MTSNRRTFIKNSMRLGVFALVYAPFKEVFGKTIALAQLPAWQDLVEQARWCPSVHNMQPHKLRVISDTEAELYYDPARLLPVGDPSCIFATVAMGIFIEHLSVVAGAFNAQVEITKVFAPIHTQANVYTLFARLRLTPALKKEILTTDLIIRRKTSRGHYNGKPISESILSTLKNQSEAYGHEFFSSTDNKIVQKIISWNQETLFRDLSLDDDRRELDSLFRYSQQEAAQKKDGLWARAIGFPGKLVKSVFHHHDKWEKGLRKKILAKHYKNSFKGTTTICWIGGKFENTDQWLSAGRMFARNWLHLTAENVFIHPFGSLITNADAYRKISENLQKPSEGKKIWMIFRAGYSKEPVRSYRLSTEEIIIKHKP